MKKLSFKTWIEKIQLVALRFPSTLFFVEGFTFLLLIQINQLSNNYHERSLTFFALGILLSLSITLFSEGFKNLYKIGLNLLAICLLLLYCFILPEKFYPVHFYQVISIGIVLSLTAFFVSFLKKENDIPFWEFSKESIIQLIITIIFAQVLMAGLSLAALSLKELFKINIDGKIYGDLAVISYVSFGGIFFLANVPDNTEKQKQIYNFNKFLKVLGLYILLPILAIYSLILYVYLIKILVSWQLPNGYVSKLVSVLGLGGFLTMLIIYPLRLEKNKVALLLSKYFPVFILPLLILMSVGIFRRLGDYGMTINRLYVLILNIWLYGISIYLFISKANQLKWIVITFASVLFLTSVGPWSVYNITKQTMLKEINQLLSESKLLKNGKVIDNQNSSIKLHPKLSAQLSEDIKYISNNYGIEKLQPFFKNSVKDKKSNDLNKMLGINEIPITDTYFNAWTDKEKAYMIDLKPYKFVLFLPSIKNDKYMILTNSETVVTFSKMEIHIKLKSRQDSILTIPLKSKIKEILKSQKSTTSHPIEEMIITSNNCKLVITSVTGNYYVQNDSIHINNLDALLLLK